MKIFYFILSMIVFNTIIDCSAALKLAVTGFGVDRSAQIDEHRLCVILANHKEKNTLIWFVPGAFIGCELANIVSPVKI